jgi:hypothetical protein
MTVTAGNASDLGLQKTYGGNSFTFRWARAYASHR